MKRTLLISALVASYGVANAVYVAYDNRYTDDAATTYLATTGGYAASGSGLVGSLITTKLIADDITVASNMVGQKANRIYWTVFNGNTEAVTARMRLRIYKNDGTTGTMGTYVTGWSFTATSLATGYSVFYFDAAGAFTYDSTFWAGMCFDNSGAANTTATQLDNIGLGLAGGPRVGSSADLFFQSTAPHAGLASGIAGSYYNFSGNPTANFAYRFESAVPEPASMIALGAGLAAIAARRRRKA